MANVFVSSNLQSVGCENSKDAYSSRSHKTKHTPLLAFDNSKHNFQHIDILPRNNIGNLFIGLISFTVH